MIQNYDPAFSPSKFEKFCGFYNRSSNITYIKYILIYLPNINNIAFL